MREDALWGCRAILGCPLRNFYGLIELCGHVILGTPYDSASDMGVLSPAHHGKLISRPDCGYTVDDVVDGKKTPRGELLIRAPVIGRTYFLNDTAFQQRFHTPGWYKTNDIVQLDMDTLTFTYIDRANNVYRNSLIHSIPIERHEKIYEEMAGVAQICLRVDSRSPFTIAVVVPVQEQLVAMAKRLSIYDTYANLCRNEDLNKELLLALRATGAKAGIIPDQLVAGIVLTPEAFTTANNQFTETFKPRRNVIYACYEKEIAELARKLDASHHNIHVGL